MGFFKQSSGCRVHFKESKEKGLQSKKAIHGFCSGMRKTEESRSATALSYKLQRRRKILNAGYSNSRCHDNHR